MGSYPAIYGFPPSRKEVETDKVLLGLVEVVSSLKEMEAFISTLPNPGILPATLPWREIERSADIECTHSAVDEVYHHRFGGGGLSVRLKELENYHKAISRGAAFG